MNDRRPSPLHDELELPIRGVTLLEDRGLVTRRALFSLPSGRSCFRIEGVAPALVDQSLSARIGANDGQRSEPATAMRVVHCAVERWCYDGELSQQEAIERERTELENQIERHREKQEMLIQLSRQICVEISRSAAEAEDPVSLKEVESDLEQLHTRQLASMRDMEQCEHRLRQLEHHDPAALVEDDARAAELCRARLLIELYNPSATAVQIELVVDYQVPGALWRPAHRAHLKSPLHTDATWQVDWQCDAYVWQNTGEDWQNVEVHCSTAQPSLGVSVPELVSDTLELVPAGQVVVEAREEEAESVLNQTKVPNVEPDAGGTLPGIDDGQHTMKLTARGLQTIAGDGTPHRIELFEFSGACETRLLCCPEWAPSACHITHQRNGATLPLLAGPVELLRNHGVVGRSSIEFVAPGAPFDLGWGTEQALRVNRELEEGKEEQKPLSSWNRKFRRVALKFSNLSDQALHYEVRERVPVSELESIRIEDLKATAGVAPDDDGIVRWQRTLAPYAQEVLELQWVLARHSKVS